MKNLEWPGIATAVGIILIVMISVDLSKWQTLASALIAFGGGVLAYRGAMAKVGSDQAEHKREFLRRQLALYLKLDLATRRFRPELQLINANISFSNVEDGVPVKVLRIKEPPEIVEAWDNLDVFPRRLIREIASIREYIRRIDDLLEDATDDRILYGNEIGSGSRLDVIHTNIGGLVDACAIIFDGLEQGIEELAPNLPDRERTNVLYGEFSDED